MYKYLNRAERRAMFENIYRRQVTFYNSAAHCALFVVLAVLSSNKSNSAAVREHISQ